MLDHGFDDPPEIVFGFPAKFCPRFAGVALENANFDRPKQFRARDDKFAVVQAGEAECQFAQLAHRMGFASRHDEIVGLLLLERGMDGPHIVRGITPVALGFEISQLRLASQPAA